MMRSEDRDEHKGKFNRNVVKFFVICFIFACNENEEWNVASYYYLYDKSNFINFLNKLSSLHNKFKKRNFYHYFVLFLSERLNYFFKIESHLSFIIKRIHTHTYSLRINHTDLLQGQDFYQPSKLPQCDCRTLNMNIVSFHNKCLPELLDLENDTKLEQKINLKIFPQFT